MPRRLLGVVRVTLLAATAVLLITCTDTTTSPRTREGPSFAISDGASGGNVDVFFLPPLVSSPKGPDYGDRPPNPNLAPVANVCALNPSATQCVDPSRPGDVASLPLAYDTAGEFYHVNWQTSGAGLVNDAKYRIQVFLGRLSLGFRDIQPEPSARGTCKTGDAFCTFQNGSSLPIKVRIETAAVCLALDPGFDAGSQPCATASLDAGESLALSDISIASVQESATISMKQCGDLRARGLVDLPTFGECVQIDDVNYIPGVTLGVTGTATLCHAYDAALAAGLSDAQADRMTVHRFSSEVDPPLVALPHAPAGDCDALTQSVRQALKPNGLDRLYRLAGRTWHAATGQVRAWIEATKLWASPSAFCHTNGCGSITQFESDYQVNQPAWMDYDAGNPGGTLPTQNVGTTVTGRIKVLDSGEFPAQSPLPAPVRNVRLTVSTTNGSVTAGTACADPNAPAGQASICTGSDGIASFTLTLGPGVNTVTVRGIGVGTDHGDPTPVDNVFAPSMNDLETSVTLGVGTLTFTATGLVPLVFVPDPPTGGSVIYTNAEGIATFPDFQVCAKPRTAGVSITSLQAVTNNGTPKNLDQLPAGPWVTGTDGCLTFSGVTINGTGAFHLMANGQYTSQKFNVKPGK